MSGCSRLGEDLLLGFHLRWHEASWIGEMTDGVWVGLGLLDVAWGEDVTLASG